MSKFSPECKSLSPSESEYKGALVLIRDVLIEKEQSRRDKVYQSTTDHRDGLDCLKFFFDLINDAAGYTSYYYSSESTNHRLSCEDLINFN